MAASTATVALSSSIVAGSSSLSSRSSFAPQIVSVVAPSSSRRGVATIRASATEEPRAVRRELLAGLVAAGAALAVAGSSFAASGPGSNGAAVTNKQATDLLKAGDALTNNESPQRFGGERVGSQAQRNEGKVAQQAGSGAVDGLQNNSDAGTNAIDKAKENVEKAGERLGDLFKPTSNSTGDLSANVVDDAVNNVEGFFNNGPGEKVKSDLDTASGKVRSDIATTKDKVTNDVASSQGLGDKAQNKASDAVKEGKGFFGDLKNKITASTPK